MLAQTLILATNWASSFLDRERQKTSNRLDKGGKLSGVVKERHQTVDLKGITKAVKVQLLSSPTGVIPTLLAGRSDRLNDKKLTGGSR